VYFTNETDVLREMNAFIATLPQQSTRTAPLSGASWPPGSELIDLIGEAPPA